MRRGPLWSARHVKVNCGVRHGQRVPCRRKEDASVSDDRLLGFVGVGRMGGPMASRLLDAGHRLIVFDTSSAATDALAARGAQVAASAADVASAAPIVFLSLPTPNVVETVAL